MAVHPAAIVEDGAKLGAGVEIGALCFVGRDVVLGDGVRLLSHVVVKGHTQIGARTVIHPQAVIGGEAQIRNNDFADAKLVVGSDCVIRECVTMNGGSRNGGGITTGSGITTVGDNGYFMAYSHIGHDCQVENDVTFANSATLAGHVHIGQGVIFGGLSAVQQHCRVGKGAMIGGVTGVNTDVIPYGMAFGDHVELAGLNLIGLKRRGLSRETIHAVRGAFRAIFQETGGSLEDRARRAKENWTGVAQVYEIADFILGDHKQPICLARKRRPATDAD